MQFNWWLCYYKPKPKPSQNNQMFILENKEWVITWRFKIFFSNFLLHHFYILLVSNNTTLVLSQHKKHDLIWKSQTILMGMYSRKTQSRFMQSITGLCWDHYQWRTRVPHSATAHTNCLNCCQINDKIDPDPLTRQIPLCIYSELRIEVISFNIDNWESHYCKERQRYFFGSPTKPLALANLSKGNRLSESI